MDSESSPANYTYQEIIRQQEGWKQALASLAAKEGELRGMLKKFADRYWVFSGCGTSYYLAQTASMLFELLTGIRTKAVPASEILLFPEVVFNKSDRYLLISMSRSGTTTEIVKAAQKARDELHIPTLAISCNHNSPLSKESELKIIFPFEQERSVVMTGSFTTMLISVLCLASLAQKGPQISKRIDTLPNVSYAFMKENESAIKNLMANGEFDDFVFLGQGPLLGIANEAALKMQEMTISVSQGYHSLEYRHGPMSTASEKTLITLLCCSKTEEYDYQLAKDLKKLGATILALSSSPNGEHSNIFDIQINIPTEYGDILGPLFFMPLLQMLAYYRAIARNINPDSPKNLTAVVQLDI